MAISFKSTFSAKKRATEILTKKKQQLGQAMSDAQGDLKADLKQGIGTDGSAMAELTPKYRDFKLGLTKGKSRSGKQKAGRGIPDMSLTGDMLRDMLVEVKELKDKLIGRIYFLTAQHKKVRGNLEKRKFFGLSEKNYQRLKKTLGVK
jgi:hypothetical protein